MGCILSAEFPDEPHVSRTGSVPCDLRTEHAKVCNHCSIQASSRGGGHKLIAVNHGYMSVADYQVSLPLWGKRKEGEETLKNEYKCHCLVIFIQFFVS